MELEWLRPAAFFGSILFALVGVLVFWISFVVIDKLTPYNLWEEIVEKQNRAWAWWWPPCAWAFPSSWLRQSTGEWGEHGPGRRVGWWLASKNPLSVNPSATQQPRPLDVALLFSVFVVAACGLLYELTAGAIASYLLGDSVLQFSTIIGAYLFAMGMGSWLSRFFDRQLPAHFLRIELMVALVGGALPALLFLANAYTPGAFRFLLYTLVLIVGTLVGLEIPLVMRILRRNVALKELVSQVLTYDYLGALAVSLAFPLVLVPKLGLIRTGLLFGLLNACVAVWALWLFRHELRQWRAHALACGLTLAALLRRLCAGRPHHQPDG